MRLRKKDEPNISETGGAIEEMVKTYAAFRYKKAIALAAFLVILILAAGYGMGVGTYPISFTEVYTVIIDRLLHWTDVATSVDMRVVWDQRLPRLLFAILAGAGLAAAGAAMQSMMKNPLADPFTTGISSGASFGATIAIAFGITMGTAQYGIVSLAFVFALVPAGVIVLLSTFKKASPAMMILAGISVMYVFNALTQYIMLVVDEQTTAAAFEWTVGSLSRASWGALPIMFATTAVGSALVFYMARYLNAMNSGDALARSLGVNTDRIRIFILIVISVSAASIVAFTGVIGFVGLVAPHMARIFIGSDNRFLIPASMLTGATLMVICDIIAKSFTATALPIGIVTSLIGGPVFLALIIRQRKEIW